MKDERRDSTRDLWRDRSAVLSGTYPDVPLTTSLTRRDSPARQIRQQQSGFCRDFLTRWPPSSSWTAHCAVSPDVARVRECPPGLKCTRLVPATNHSLATSGNTNGPFAGILSKPSDGLEPSTPSLPSRREPRARAGSRGHESRARRRNRLRRSSRVCPLMPGVAFPQCSLVCCRLERASLS